MAKRYVLTEAGAAQKAHDEVAPAAFRERAANRPPPDGLAEMPVYDAHGHERLDADGQVITRRVKPGEAGYRKDDTARPVTQLQSRCEGHQCRGLA